MKKYYVLDTNVLLHDPTALTHFEDNHVIIPLKVLEEVDKFKREVTERGRNARQVSRMLDDLRKKGRLCDPSGVPLENGGDLSVAFPANSELFDHQAVADDVILRTALELKGGSDRPVVMVSKDINLRLKADALGLLAEDYENGRAGRSPDELYAGWSRLEISAAQMDEFKAERRIVVPGDTLVANEYLVLTESGNEGRTLLARYDREADRAVALIGAPDGMQPIRPRNPEQQFAVDALLNDRIKVVTLLGKAGTGKTLLAIAAGVYKTMEEKSYEKMLISRPTFPMGKDIGFLPGSLQEKLDPWMQPIYDALDLIRHGKNRQQHRDPILSNERIEVEPLSYIRGRSIPNQFMVVDEAQNLTPLEIKTVITRVGHGTKIVLTGDIYQIDNPYVDALSNGLNYLVEKMKGQHCTAHVELREGVRSEVAELAANLL